MVHRGRPGNRSLPAAVTAALVATDVPDVTPAEIAAAAAHVDRSIGAMPDSTRAAVRGAALASGLALSALTRGDFRRQSADRQQRAVLQFARLPLPVLGEFARLTRGLGLVSVFEGRSAAERGRQG